MSTNPNPLIAKRERQVKYFEPFTCSTCPATSDLKKHRYTDAVMCDDCIEKINNELQAVSELEEYNYGSLSELLTERAE